MKDKELKKLLHEDMLEDAERIMEKINSDPNLKDVEAPDTLKEKLFNKIHEYEAELEAERKSAEEKELIRLGKIYKRRRKLGKVAVLVAAVIAVLAIGITGLGGPEKVLQEFKRKIGDREQSYLNTDDDKTTEIDYISEDTAYEEIEDTFGTFPVKAIYLPDNMIFVESVIEKETQNARLFYDNGAEKAFCITMFFDYRTTSIGGDVEDDIIREYEKEKEGTLIKIKQYFIGDSDEFRWGADFEYGEVQYFLLMSGFTETEVQKTIEGLHFTK